MKKFETINGEALLTAELPSVKFIVSNLVPEGLHILGGASKIGKSWMMLDLCYKVSMGLPFLGHETRKGTVLYLSLEDSVQRLQSRLLDITNEAPANLVFSTMAESIENGLTEQIENFIAENPDTNFIVIDTLQNIREAESDTNIYANDYREVGVLKRIAYDNGIAILLVHHLKKGKEIDPLNMLTGSTGLSGVVDSAFVLFRKQRTDPYATLFCTGRDIESKELRISFDGDTHRWNLIEPQEENKLLDKTIEVIHKYFSTGANSYCGTAQGLSDIIAKACGVRIPAQTIKKKLLLYKSDFCKLGYTC